MERSTSPRSTRTENDAVIVRLPDISARWVDLYLVFAERCSWPSYRKGATIT